MAHLATVSGCVHPKYFERIIPEAAKKRTSVAEKNMMKRYQLALLPVSVLLVNCAKPNLDDSVSASSVMKGQVANRDMNKYPLNKVVCDPMGGPIGTNLKNGIEGSLAYRGATQPRWFSASEYLTKGVKSDKKLFFTDLFVPTRMFSEGFATQTSSVVTNDIGEKLIEYFGLKFKTELRLTEKDAPGAYDLAVLADDGVTVSMLDANGSNMLINGDGDHSTRMSCGSAPLNMTAGSGKTLNIDYYQGPRYHIALVMMWRPAQAGKDVQCDQQGTHMYFDPDHDSKPTQKYKDLLARGWKPIPAENFFLPDQVEVNPCVPGEPLQLQGPTVREVFYEQVDIVWTTSRAATSQVLVKDLLTGAETLTSSDQMLRTGHEVSVTGLISGRTYQFRAVSVAEDGGKVISIPLTITLPSF